jgi:hypothetical protein
MPLRMFAGRRMELSWWWEDRPSGEPVPLLRDPHAARRFFAGLGARPETLLELRQFLREHAPWRPVSPDDRDVVDGLVAALAAGEVYVADAEGLGAREGVVEEAEAEPARAPAATEPAAPLEEPCWPCLQRAAASATALRDAAAAGTPFVVQG